MIGYSDTMKLSKRNDTGAYVIWIDGKRHSLKKFCGRTITDGKEAKRIFTAIRQEWLAGKLSYIKGETYVTIEQFKDEYLAWAIEVQNKHTYAGNRKALDKLVEYGGKSMRLDRIGQKVIDTMTTDLLKKSRKPNTINCYIRHAKTVMNKAVEWEYLRTNPLKGVKQIPGGNTEPGFLDAAQAKDYIKKIKDIHVKRMAVAYIFSGLRRTELLALEYPRDIDSERGLIRVERKKKRHLVVEWMPMHPMFKAVLNSMDLDEGKRIFRRWRHPDTITHKVKDSLRAAGYGHLKLHSLRHTTGALLAMEGYGAKTIAEVLGHAQTHTADIYTHVTKDHVTQALQAVNLGPIDLGNSSGIRPVDPENEE
ncbi:tyrosine-type recombinase/integrase [Pseudodesulfovibrio sediminis]|uniref:Site-specific integrase n=1 Tax=Pseudodesulfovibrio sediminis TaxID=2810563 RepID=A0ABN6EQM1_9BACT|nr:tyrosine-type recombinase/integrase [Pseudodesulfovibrio sediminis]BCS87369.1 site-specific integrase [Pseudodesulfovibrio sediminis]